MHVLSTDCVPDTVRALATEHEQVRQGLWWTCVPTCTGTSPGQTCTCLVLCAETSNSCLQRSYQIKCMQTYSSAPTLQTHMQRSNQVHIHRSQSTVCSLTITCVHTCEHTPPTTDSCTEIKGPHALITCTHTRTAQLKERMALWGLRGV